MDLRTGAAFWPLRNGLIAVYPPLERDERCDVAIIGAGITGALAARRLTEADCDVSCSIVTTWGWAALLPAPGCCSTRPIHRSASSPRRWASSARCEAGALA